MTLKEFYEQIDGSYVTTGTTGFDRYIFNGQIDRNIINCDTALDV